MTNDKPRPDVESSIWIARPPQDIWDFLALVSTDTQWRNGVLDARWTSEPPYGVGSTGMHIVQGVGDWPWRVLELEEPHIMAWEVTGGRFEGSHAAYRLEPEGDGSRFIMETSFKRSILMSLLRPVLKGMITRGNAGDLEKLKSIMEAETPGIPLPNPESD